MKILGIIPAQQVSRRFPGKPHLVDALLLLGAALATLAVFATGCKSSQEQQVAAGSEIRLSPVAEKSPFKDYDRHMVHGIQRRWYELLGQADREQKPGTQGFVIVQFHLMQDGRVRECKVMKSSVDSARTLLCQKAILDPSPFLRWPDDMARMVNAPYRELRFTFYYN